MYTAGEFGMPQIAGDESSTESSAILTAVASITSGVSMPMLRDGNTNLRFTASSSSSSESGTTSTHVIKEITTWLRVSRTAPY
jgi:hypothetical protein